MERERYNEKVSEERRGDAYILMILANSSHSLAEKLI